MFCPIRSNKSRNKSSHQASRNRETNNQNNNGHHTNPDTTAHHATSISSMKIVNSDYHAVADDELTVAAGDHVFFLDTDGNWSNVVTMKTSQRGYVPSEILSECGQAQHKKKLPCSNANRVHQSLGSHHSQPLHLHNNKRREIGEPSSHGDTMTVQHQHIHRHHQPRFGMSHSLHGSSGEQSFPLPRIYPELGHHFSPTIPAYSNVCSPDHHELYDPECRPFIRQDHGLYVVTNHFIAREENDLTVEMADYVRVLNKDDDNWYWVRREMDLFEGFVPSKFICDCDQVKSILNKGNSTVTTKSSNHNDVHIYINHRPDRESLPTDQQSSVLNPI